MAYLQRRFGPGYALVSLSITVRGSDGIMSQAQLRPAVPLLSGPAGSQETDPGNIRSQIEKALQDSPVPLKGRAIARRVNRPFTSYFREVLADMRDRGRLILAGGGYWLSARPLPTDGFSG